MNGPYTSGTRTHPRHLIAESFTRRGGDIPSPVTLARADEALTTLAEEGWVIVANPLTIWAVNQRYSELSHGYEPVALFSTEAAAQAFRDRCEARQAADLIEHAEYYKTSTKPDYTFEVEAWTVHDDWEVTT